MIATKNKIFKLAGVAFTCAVIAACSADVSNPPPLNSGTASAGNADFTKFVAIGDSLTAGYADGALYLLGQQNSFPNMLAQQFADVGGGAFTQPLVGDNLGGLLAGGIPLLHPVTGDNMFQNRFVLNTETESPERLEGVATEDVIGTGLNGMAFNNVGVPGAKSFHLVLALPAPGYGNFNNLPTGEANPYFVRFASDNTVDGITVIGDAAAQAPSFYSLWIGNNDVLSFATSGGYDDFQLKNAEDQTGNLDPSTYGPNDITDPTVFAGAYAALVGAMAAANPDVQGVLINIPDVSTIPYFTTVPYNAIPMTQADADAANAGYVAYNAGLQAAVDGLVITAEEAAQRTIFFAEGQNALVILDETLTPIGGPETFLRQATAEDLVLLTAASTIGELNDPMDPASVIGVGFPLGDELVLIPSEIEAINTARTAYNVTIKAEADADPNLVFVDAAAILAELTSGLSYGNGSITADFATGGGFSLDGVHPTARGYAVIANSIIDAINTGFDANVYKVDPATYPTVFLK